MSLAPVPMRYEGEGAFTALPRFRAECDAHLVIGEVYRLANIEDRSDASHKHEFAFVREAWKNLPEDLADLYPSAKHLRKRALIQAGFYDEQIIDVGTNAGAIRVAQGVRARPGEEFSLVIVRGGLVVIRNAKSQARGAMDREEFQRSKQAILDILADMLGTDTASLGRAA